MMMLLLLGGTGSRCLSSSAMCSPMYTHLYPVRRLSLQLASFERPDMTLYPTAASGYDHFDQCVCGSAQGSTRRSRSGSGVKHQCMSSSRARDCAPGQQEGKAWASSRSLVVPAMHVAFIPCGQPPPLSCCVRFLVTLVSDQLSVLPTSFSTPSLPLVGAPRSPCSSAGQPARRTTQVARREGACCPIFFPAAAVVVAIWSPPRFRVCRTHRKTQQSEGR